MTAHPTRATLVATLTVPPQAGAFPDLSGVEWLEVRADLIGDLDPAPLRAAFAGKLLYTLRSRAEGGGFEGSADRRRRRLLDAAAAGYDLIDLECERDLSSEVLNGIAPGRRILSWHGGAVGLQGLKSRFEKMAACEALLYKMVPAAAQAGEELAPLLLLHQMKRTDLAAFASGVSGAWTRLVAPRLGAPVVYAAASEVPGAPGQISLARLREDYGLPDLPPVAVLFGIVGNPVAHSLSPRLHNGAYRALGLPALYLPFHAASFGDFWLEVVESGIPELFGMPLRGLSVTAPYKEAALAVAGAESPRAARIGAANTLVWNEGVWEAESTDPEGVVLPLLARGIDPAGRTAAVVGAGGAGRSSAVGLAVAGARVTLVNRSSERGERAGEELGLPFLPLERFDPSAYELLVNATSLGRDPEGPLPFPVDRLRPGSAVIDLVYDAARPGPTRLLTLAAAQGAVAIDGREVLLSQALGQFRMMTGREIPLELARRLLQS
ncbi:MAG TPA: type I 3-dehydroquinate dehydratase [Thermoanaerobaculia bacterium]|nr:type I 3-dehydroquinate dehydratase [Thermoanaerobaculia bacterium]